MANGFKVFSVGEVLTAADVNDYLMEQSIGIFADSTARDAQITSPIEGQFCYLADSNVLQFYNGSSWANFIGEGDISSVVAGTGLDGGGTSGAVTINFDPNSLTAGTVNVANDSVAIIDADDSNNPKKESIADFVSAIAGTNLTASSGQLNATGGKILQVVTATTVTDTGALATTSFQDTGLSGSITPSASGSKVLVIINQTLQMQRSAATQQGHINILRGSTQIYENFFAVDDSSDGDFGPAMKTIIFLDSPSTTSATTYKTQIKANTTSNSGSVRANQQLSGSNESFSSIHLVEIGA